MKKALLLLFLSTTASLAHAQKTELSAHLNGGLFAFRGASTERTTFFNLRGDAYQVAYTNNPYGSRAGRAYGAAGQVQRVTHGHALFGVQIGYERLRSRVAIDRVWSRLSGERAAIGHVNLGSSFINVHPFVGRRFGLKGLVLDVSAGPETGYFLQSRERGDATEANGSKHLVSQDRSHPKTDFRLRGNATVYYRKLGLSTSYSYGLTNYQAGYVGGTNEAAARVWRLGVVYRLK